MDEKDKDKIKQAFEKNTTKEDRATFDKFAQKAESASNKTVVDDYDTREAKAGTHKTLDKNVGGYNDFNKPSNSSRTINPEVGQQAQGAAGNMEKPVKVESTQQTPASPEIGQPEPNVSSKSSLGIFAQIPKNLH